MTSEESPLLTAAEAATLLGVTVPAIHQLRRAGRIEYLRGRPVLFERKAVDEYIQWRRGFVTDDQAAVILDVPAQRIHYWRTHGRIEFIKGRPSLVSLASLEDFRKHGGRYILELKTWLKPDNRRKLP